MTMKPRSLPQQSKDKTVAILQAHGVDTSKPAILGMRGYFRDSMGEVGKNDRGIYDDALFVYSPKEFKSYWANTDPSRYRKGHGESESTKGMASLCEGVWKYKRGLHRGNYPALVQANDVLVKRDGSPDYYDKGWFGINIHRGGYTTTSSLGCQTIHPDLWTDFMRMVNKVMDEGHILVIPYCLVEQQG